jgi:hypothetical protein
MGWFGLFNKKKKKTADHSPWYKEIKKQIYKGADKHADGGRMVICSHDLGMPTESYRKSGNHFCIKQLLGSATAEWQQSLGEDLHIDVFIEQVEMELEAGTLQSAENNHWRFDADHHWNRMTEEQRKLFSQGGGGDS